MSREHGSIDAYYDRCKVECKVAKEKEVYISAEGLAFPCCWLAGELYRADMSNQQRQVVRLVRAAFPGQGLEALSLRQRGGLARVVDRKGGLFDQLIHAAVLMPSVADGRLQTCSAVCGAQVRGFAKQFDGSAQQRLVPALRPQPNNVRPEPQEQPRSELPMLIWYGSVTGNAARLANRLAAAVGPATVSTPTPPPLAGTDFGSFLRHCRLLVLVLATWGDGLPTDDVLPFLEWVGRGAIISSDGVQQVKPKVAVFGVGSSYWPRFNAAAQRATTSLAAAGFPELVPGGCSDEAVGEVDAQFELWLQEQLLPSLAECGLVSNAQALAAAVTGSKRQEQQQQQQQQSVAVAVPLLVRACRRLAPGDTTAIYCEVELAGHLPCGAGDAVGILPPAAADITDRRPRWYTLSSAPAAATTTSFNTMGQHEPLASVPVMRITVREVPDGLCSTWLCKAEPGSEILCLPPRRPSPLVSAWQARCETGIVPPLLLIANGAGIAPFIALLELLAARASDVRPRCMLWMGCRQQGNGMPHAPRLVDFMNIGVLQRLVVAESKPASPFASSARRYVQDTFRDDKEEVGRLLFPKPPESTEEALLLVCGTAAMGASVRQVVSEIAAERGGRVEDLEQDSRFVAELW